MGAFLLHLAQEIPTVGNDGVDVDLTLIIWKLIPELLWSDVSDVAFQKF